MRPRAVLWAAAALAALVVLLVVRFPNPDAVRPNRDGAAVRVATYNVWNVMFQWRTRAAYIAEQIGQTRPDIVVMQEAVSYDNDGPSHIGLVRARLPEYAWDVFIPTTYHTPAVGSPANSAGWWEGIALLSRHQIVGWRHVNLTNPPNSPDTNTRILLHSHVRVATTTGLIGVDVFATHMSYAPLTQCAHALEIGRYVDEWHGHRASNTPLLTVLAGDLNIYPTDTGIIRSLTILPELNQPSCEGPLVNLNGRTEEYIATDAGTFAGDTFSNMPTPGLVSRPDRILMFEPKSWQTQRAFVVDGSAEYASVMASRLNWARWRTAWRNPNVCEHDCGPRGACRCGVCVLDEQQTPCPLNPKGPQCAVCAGMRSVVVYIAQVLVVTIIIGIAVTLQSMRWPYRRLHVVLVVLFWAAVGIVLAYRMGRHWLAPVRAIVEQIMPEELNPSDHRMLVVDIVSRPN